METLLFDISIYWKWLGTNHKQVLWWSNEQPAINFSSGQVTKPAFRQSKSKEYHNIKVYLAKNYNTFVPNLEAKPVVPKLTTRDGEHC